MYNFPLTTTKKKQKSSPRNLCHSLRSDLVPSEIVKYQQKESIFQVDFGTCRTNYISLLFSEKEKQIKTVFWDTFIYSKNEFFFSENIAGIFHPNKWTGIIIHYYLISRIQNYFYNFF